MAWQLREAKSVIFRLELGIMDTQTIIDCLQALQKDICPGSTTGLPLPQLFGTVLATEGQ